MAEVNQERYQSQRYKRSQVPLPEAPSNDYGRRQSMEDAMAINMEEEKKMSRSNHRFELQNKAAFNSFIKGEDHEVENNYYFNRDSIVVDK